MEFKLRDAQEVYRKLIEQKFGKLEEMKSIEVVDYLIDLFEEVHAEGISNEDDPDYDMLLFQYNPEHSSREKSDFYEINMTRQFMDPDNDEPYQLSLTLIYDIEPFSDKNWYNRWSSDDETVEEFRTAVKNTEAYKIAEKLDAIKVEYEFFEC